jgi:Tol biopolymer transport system component
MVVYEAATGRRLHGEAQTVGELRARRLEAAAPPLRDERPDLPRRLCDVVDRCLARVPDDRYPSGKELAAALAPLTSRATGSRARLWIAAAVVTVGGATAFATTRHGPGAPTTTPSASPAAAAAAPASADRVTTPPLSLRLANVRRVTFGDSCEEFPSFTPDGRAIVYDGTVGADSFIYRLDLGEGSTPRQLTHVRGWDIAASLSPGGDRMAFVRFEGEHIGAFVGPADGSAAPHLVARGAVRPSWTRDGRAIWAGSGAPLAAYDADTGAIVRTAKSAPNVRTAQTIELPDGSLLAGLPLHESADASVGGIALFPPDGGPRWLLTGNVDEVLALSPDGRHALASRPSATGVELMDVPVDGSPATSLASSGVAARKGLAFSPDGKRITWSACTEVPQVAGVEPRGRTLRVLKDDLLGPQSLANVPGTSTIAVVSARAGKPEPWIVDPSGRVAPRAIPIGSLSAADIAVSGDGSRFVISVPADGLYIGSLHGDPQIRRLTQSSWDSLPSFRFGDREVVYTRRSPDAPPCVMSVPVEGGEPRPLLAAGSDNAAPSPVADRIAYVAGNSSAEVVPTVWDGATGTTRPLSSSMPIGRYGYLRFSPDGRHVALVRGDTDVVEVDVATGIIVRRLTTPTGDQLAHPTYGPSGLVIVRVHWQGNIWLADVSPR